jgi:hypothetical protein
VSTVRSGTDTGLGGSYQNERWYQGSGRTGEKPVESIVSYPPTRGVVTQGDPFEPVKIGVLIDMDLGQLTADLMDPIILAVEDALNEDVYDRPRGDRHHRCPRPAQGELPEGPRGLPAAGGRRLRGRDRPPSYPTTP